MKQTVSNNDFHQAFQSCGRGEQFSYEALDALFEHLESLESDMGQEMELDVVALCCEYSEEDYKDIASSYDIDLEDAEGDEADEIELVIEHLQDEGVFIASTSDNKILYRQY